MVRNMVRNILGNMVRNILGNMVRNILKNMHMGGTCLRMHLCDILTQLIPPCRAGLGGQAEEEEEKEEGR